MTPTDLRDTLTTVSDALAVPRPTWRRSSAG